MNTDITIDKKLDKIYEMLKNIENIPHGSGIDYLWRMTLKNDKLTLTNAWHYMNDNGYYMCSIPFSITLNLTHNIEPCFSFKWHNYKVYKYYIQKAKNELIQDYIEIIMNQWLSDSIGFYG